MRIKKGRVLSTFVVLLCLLLGASEAMAMRSRGRSRSRSRTSSAARTRSPWVNKFEMGGYAGWLMAGELALPEGDLVIVNEVTYGGQLDITLMPGSQLELQFGRVDTRVDRKRFGEAPELLTDMAINYYQIGGIYEPSPFKRIKPFVLGTLGATHFLPSDPRFSSELAFSVAFGLGFKIFLHPRIGLRAQARVLMPIYFSGSAFICGPSTCAGYVEAGVPMAQGDFTGGMFVTF